MRSVPQDIRNDIKFAFESYISESAYDMNRVLAGMDPIYASEEEIGALISGLNTAFDKVGTPAEPGTYYRAMHVTDAAAIASLEAGDEFVCNTYSSVTESHLTLNGFSDTSNAKPIGIEQHIIVKEGARPNRLYGNEYEFEHVFEPGTRFRILQTTTVTGSARSRIYQVLEVIK